MTNPQPVIVGLLAHAGRNPTSAGRRSMLVGLSISVSGVGVVCHNAGLSGDRREMASRSTETVGCDVARGAWVAVILHDGAFHRAIVASSLREVAAACSSAQAIVVDIPGIHMPKHAGEAGRVRPDDLVDAGALAWTAAWIAAGEARRLGDPDTPIRDHAIYF
jgi:hypothetical protein